MLPLRERREDIALLAGHFIEKHCGRSKPAITQEAISKLENYSFPGNVRELENIIERALIYCENSIIRDIDIDLHESSNTTTAHPASAAIPTEASAANEKNGAAHPELPADATLDEIEKQAIINALARCDGNRTKAAELLGVSRKTILNKIKQFGLE